MCGINGITVSDKQLIQKMNEQLRHRGPDDNGIYVDSEVSLGCCRLKVIDLSQKGHQPMSNEEGDLWVVFNGEIYNFREIRKELEETGYTFFSNSDTEVILHGYEAWGPEVVSRLAGMWAIAVYDANKRLIFLSRDRTGIKPLYYLNRPTEFAFSSELKIFATLEEMRRPICWDGVRDVLMFNFNPGKRTSLDSVYKLGSGESLIYNIAQRTFKIWRYWTNEPEGSSPLDEDVLENLIQRVVKEHLVSDVPVGCYVSGGIDSSVVATFYAREYPGKLHSFHITFEDHREEQEDARLLAERLGTEHHELELSPNQVLHSFEEIVHYYDLSITDPAFIPNYFLSKYAKHFVTVVLAGEGGDELFAGYDYYRYFATLRKFGLASLLATVPVTGILAGLVPAANERMMRGLYSLERMGEPEQFLLRYLTVLPETALSSILGVNVDGYFDEVANELRTDFNFRARDISCMLLLDQKTLLAENYNYKADKSTSAASLEERVPLEDHKLVTYMNAVPFDQKVSAFKGKMPLRKIIAKELPELSGKRKRGFVTPYGQWMRGPLSAKLESAVKIGRRITAPNSTGFEKIYGKFVRGDANPSEGRLLWNLLLLIEGLKSYSYVDD